MSTTQLIFVFTGLFFLFIFLFGFRLSRSGKPYPAAVFNIHKLLALGAVVYLGVNIYNIHQVAPLSPVQIAAVVVTVLCFAATIATGGLLSVEKEMPGFVLKLHQILLWVTVVSAAGMLYLILA
jgi:hypothetical protein